GPGMPMMQSEAGGIAPRPRQQCNRQTRFQRLLSIDRGPSRPLFRGEAAKFTRPRVASRGNISTGALPGPSFAAKPRNSPDRASRRAGYSTGALPGPSFAAKPRNSPDRASRRAGYSTGALPGPNFAAKPRNSPD